MKYRITIFPAGEDGDSPPRQHQVMVWQDVRDAVEVPGDQHGTGRRALRVTGAGPSGAYHGDAPGEIVVLEFAAPWPEAMVEVGLAGGKAMHGGFRAKWEPANG